jgi:Sulfotransferase domain
VAPVQPPTLLERLRPRRLRVLGIGSPKSGTHSLAGVFEARYRTAHEPNALELAGLIAAVADGEATEADLDRELRRRERRLRLEVNSAGLNGLVVERLVPLSSRTRFVLTLRDPWSWVESIIDHSLRGDPAPVYLRLRELRYGTRRPHPPAERVLADHGLFTLDGYLGSWAERNQRALDVVPAERLLVLRTDQLGDRLGDLAAFVGCPVEHLDPARSHEYAAPERSGLLAQVDPDHVRDRIEHHAGALLDRFFPELVRS